MIAVSEVLRPWTPQQPVEGFSTKGGRIFMSDMNGRVALVTGASSGIGRATAELFAARGAKVVVAARRQDELDKVVADIEARGGIASAIATDVSISAEVARMVAHAIATYGRLDYAINNAGIEGRLAPITDLPEDEWDDVMNINLKGTFLCLQHEARAMRAAGNGGSIVNVGSVNSSSGLPRLRPIAHPSTASSA